MRQASYLAEALAKETGVAEADVAKILDRLGADATMKNVSAAAGAERLKALKIGDLKLAVRLAPNSHSV